MKRIGILLLVIILFSSILFSNVYAVGFDIDAAAQSVLKIYAFKNIGDKEPFKTGSGFVAFNGATLITNYHVIEGTEEVWALDDNDKVYALNYVLCADVDYDVAILEFESRTSLKPLDLFPSDHLKRGEQVVAIGSPKGIKNSVSTGIISSVFDVSGIPFIMTTAPISPGSSGGALLDDNGRVIGITSATYASKDEYGDDTNAQNLNYALNIAVAQAMYNAWDGTKYTFANHKTSAKMDFTNVYRSGEDLSLNASQNKNTETDSNNESTTWTCPNCGSVNTDNFCQECGTEKPKWTCACGRVNNGKFCGNCGKKADDLVADFNKAMELALENQHDEAIKKLKELGDFDSGSYST